MIITKPFSQAQASPPNHLIISYYDASQSSRHAWNRSPIVLIVGSLLLDEQKLVQISISAYYYTSMRNLFVGILCGVALFLFCYHGYDFRDSLVSKSAGLFALCIAFFPTSETADKGDVISKLHYIFAGCFFVALSYMSIFLFTKSGGHKTPEKIKRNRIYILCGILMMICVACIALYTIPTIHRLISFLKPILLFETVALLAFGFSWLTKGEFLLKDQ
jgi:drug/metabolite transporter (DMT)-like permease